MAKQNKYKLIRDESLRDLMIVHCGDHAVAAELLNIGYTAAVDFHTVGFL